MNNDPVNAINKSQKSTKLGECEELAGYFRSIK